MLLKSQPLNAETSRKFKTNVKKEMENMGMTDKQFQSYVRFLLDALKEAKEEQTEEKRNEKLDKVIVNLQATLED